MKVPAFLVLFSLAIAVPSYGDGYASPPRPNTGPPPLPPRVGIDQKLGARVPLDLPFKDERWKLVSLGECVSAKPTILVLAYYRCPMLCNEVLNGLLRTLVAIPEDVGSTFNVVVVSFDPREKPPLAALKKATYLERYGRAGTEAGWHFLTGESLAIEHLATAVGFRYEYDAKSSQYAHGSGIMVLAPDGTLARYFLGVQYESHDLRQALGGDPVLFQHLFWFYSHPAVYIMILPGMGVISELIPCFSRKNIFGYKFVAWASVSLALFSFLVWGHHMFVAGQSLYASMVFSALSYLVAVPSAIKVFNWTATLYRGSIAFDAPMLYALGFIALFTIGGLTGLFLAALAVDQHVHDTYFIGAHFHFIMVGGMVSAYFAGLHYWWPKMTGRLYSRPWSQLASLLIFSGFMLTFLPQFVLGYLGMPRRYHQYPPEFQVLNVLSSAGASILAAGYLLPFAYFVHSLRRGKPAGPNPWAATGLEWQSTSPPPPHNFEQVPIVTGGPYEYSSGGQHHGR